MNRGFGEHEMFFVWRDTFCSPQFLCGLVQSGEATPPEEEEAIQPEEGAKP
jgi:hypothetical protein